ncbi:hypothetical protein M5K25_019141 [Dendrobium thyrsiflorum]|uniref:Uncharacterized protein n=1 Tax=Dendrobium thyrsiflorum TaxID=117978 RepID=A0ABD0ULB9_DENTH
MERKQGEMREKFGGRKKEKENGEEEGKGRKKKKKEGRRMEEEMKLYLGPWREEESRRPVGDVGAEERMGAGFLRENGVLMAAKKVNALEERLEGEMRQKKAMVEDRISVMEGQVSDLHKIVKKILENQNQMVASEARGVVGRNTNSEIRRRENDLKGGEEKVKMCMEVTAKVYEPIEDRRSVLEQRRGFQPLHFIYLDLPERNKQAPF